MNTWQKLKCGCLFLFGGFESVVDYLFGLVNNWLKSDKVAANVQLYRAKVCSVLSWLSKYEMYCPAKWIAQYRATIYALESVFLALEDNEITKDEIVIISDKFAAAYKMWLED